MKIIIPAICSVDQASDPRDALLGTDVSDAAIAEALQADLRWLRTFIRSARGIVQEYAREHPRTLWDGNEIDPMGAHAWLAAESKEVGTARDGGDPKVEGKRR